MMRWHSILKNMDGLDEARGQTSLVHEMSVNLAAGCVVHNTY